MPLGTPKVGTQGDEKIAEKEMERATGKIGGKPERAELRKPTGKVYTGRGNKQSYHLHLRVHAK